MIFNDLILGSSGQLVKPDESKLPKHIFHRKHLLPFSIYKFTLLINRNNFIRKWNCFYWHKWKKYLGCPEKLASVGIIGLIEGPPLEQYHSAVMLEGFPRAPMKSRDAGLSYSCTPNYFGLYSLACNNQWENNSQLP